MKKKRLLGIVMMLMVGFFAVMLGVNRLDAAPSGKGVGTVKELQKAIDDGEKDIYLTADIEIPGYLTISDGKNVKLDLNGKVITLNSNETSRSDIKVTDATLTICDSSKEQTGEITGGYSIGGFGGAITLRRATLNLESGTISKSTARWGGAIAILDGSTFNMKGGVIEKNLIYAPKVSGSGSGYGGGVAVINGTFNMSGGVIRGNQEEVANSNKGGGVAVLNDGVFNMTGGMVGDHTIVNGANSISGNGAGVYVLGGTFNMSGGTVENNVTSANGGGIYLDEGSTLKLTAPDAVFFNMATGDGAGIYVKNATVEIAGTSIYRNEAGSEGGAIYIDKAQTKTISVKNTVINDNMCGDDGGAIYLGCSGLGLENVTIKDNITTTGNGGAVSMYDNTVLNMAGGSISGNTAKGGRDASTGLGGAIYQTGSSNAALTGVSISGNIANDGGAIYVGEQASCTLNSTAVTGNTAESIKADSKYVGGGVTVKGSLKVANAVVVEDNKHINKKTEKTVRNSNVLLDENAYIELSEPLNDDANIGVWKNGDTKMVTSNYGSQSFSIWRTKPERYFFSDNDEYFAQKDPALPKEDSYFHEVFLVKPKHEHTIKLVDKELPNCIETGKDKYYSCGGCEHIFAAEDAEYEILHSELELAVDANNHIGPFTESEEVITEPKCTKTGSRKITVTCDGCKKVVSTRTEDIPATGHNMYDIYEMDGVQGHGQKCKNCDYYWFIPDSAQQQCEHKSLDEHEKVDPTCTTSGMEAYAVCKDCGAYFGYNEDSIIVELNDDQIEALYIAPLGHSEEQEDGEPKWYIDEDSIVDVTCFKDGSYDEVTQCERCGTHLRRRTIIDPCHGHDFDEGVNKDCMLFFTCKRCGEIEEIGPVHSMLEIGKVDPTCTVNGHEAFYVCTNCLKMFDHYSYFEEFKDVETTYDDVVIAAKGHDFGDWEVLEEPTAAQKGIEIHYCSRCDAFETRDMDTVVTYKYIKGENEKWTKGSTEGMTFKVQRSYKDEETFSKWFVGDVYIDEDLLPTSAYTAKEGCVEIVIDPSYLEELMATKHIITLEFEDAPEVDAYFEIVEAETEASTDDTTEVSTDDTTEASSEDTSEVTSGDKSEDASSEDKTEQVSEQATEAGTSSEAKIDEKATENNSDKSVKTNDSTPVVLCIVCAAASAVMIIICLIMRARKKKRQNGDKDDTE